jgi:hypothetical protein
LRRLKKIYAFIFYVQYRCATFIGSEKSGAENAVFGMSILQTALILELICSIAMLTGHTPIVIPKWGAALGYLLILLFTYLVMVRKHRWLPYKAEFEQYSQRKHFLASLSVGILMAAIIVGLGVVKYAIYATSENEGPTRTSPQNLQFFDGRWIFT